MQLNEKWRVLTHYHREIKLLLKQIQILFIINKLKLNEKYKFLPHFINNKQAIIP